MFVHSRVSIHVIIGIAMMVLPLTSFAIRREDDLTNTLRAIIQPLRISGEAMESTEKTYKTLPIFGVTSFSYPVTWATRPVLQTKALEPRFSKIVTDGLVQKLLFKPAIQKDGTVSFGMPLEDFLTGTYSPLIIDNKDTAELQVIRVQKIIAKDLPRPPENRGFIQFCSFKPVKKTGATSETTYISTLEDIRSRLIGDVTMHHDINFDGDFYVPNLYEHAATDSTFLGLPAIKFTMTFDSQKYDFVSERMKYEGLYTLKDGKVVCAEVVAIEPQFESYQQVFQSVVQSAKTNAPTTVTAKPSDSVKKAPASKAKNRLCKRAKKC